MAQTRVRYAIVGDHRVQVRRFENGKVLVRYYNGRETWVFESDLKGCK